MATWLNHAAIAAPSNGTASHTVTPSSGTVVVGSLFTPAAGNLLVCVVEGAVTTFGTAAGTAPTGWTLPSGGFAVNNTGLYVFTKTADGSDTLVANHNGSNYPIICDFYEYAAGSTFSGAISATGVIASGGANPVLTGLTGTNHIYYLFGQDNTSTTVSSVPVTWSSGTKVLDSATPQVTTDGYVFSTALAADSTATSSPANTATHGQSVGGASTERLTYAVKIGASAPVTVYPSRPRVARYPTMRAAVI